MKSFRKIIISTLCLLLATLTLILSSCSPAVSASSSDLSGQYSRKAGQTGTAAQDPEDKVKLSQDFDSVMVNFGLKLFAGVIDGKEGNQLISPVSAAYCLAMITNGASGETLEQLENMFGMDIDKLNESLYSFAQKIQRDTEKAKVKLADSIWIKNKKTLHVEPDFLQINADWYNAQVYSSPFDTQTAKDINAWVNKNTDGMIKEIADESRELSGIMYLINTIVFDAKWAEEYEKKDIIDETFRNADGSRSDVKMLCSTEEYFEGDGFVGLTKLYDKGEYAFKALLPKNENTDIYEFAAGLTYEDWQNTRKRVTREIDDYQITVSANARIPEFSFDSDEMNLNDVIAGMGAPDMFKYLKADFSALGHSDDGNIYCEKVAQKTHIELDRNGTKAAAVTWGVMTDESADVAETVVNVFLDRPFVYAIVDTQTNLPLFIGIVSQLD